MKRTVSTENKQSVKTMGFHRGNITVLAGSNAIGGFGRGIMNPYLALYFVGIGGDPIKLGLLTSITSVIRCVILFLGGVTADQYGRKRIIVLAAFYGVPITFLYAFVQDWRIFAAISIISVFEAASSPAVHAIVADSIPSQRRTTGIASLQVVSSLPAIFAPLIGGLLIKTYGLSDGFRLACICTTITGLASAFILFFFLKETRIDKAGQKSKLLSNNVLKNFAKLLTQLPRSLKALLISYALIVFANALVGQYYIFYATRVIGLTTLEWGIILSLQTLLTNIVKIPGGWISDRFGKRKVMIISVLACAPCTIIFISSRSFLQVAIAALLLIVTGIYYAPAHEALQADLTPKAIRGRTTAIWDILIAVSGALGVSFGGFLFQAVNAAVPFYLFTVIELFAAFLIISSVREPSEKEI